MHQRDRETLKRVFDYRCLNRRQLVAHRRERRRLQSAHETQSRQLQRLKRSEKKIQDLTEQLERLKSPDGDD